MNKNGSPERIDQLKSLLTNLLDNEAIQSHKVDSECTVTFSYEEKVKKTISIPLRGLFCPKNLQKLTIKTKTLEKYAFESKKFSSLLNKNEFPHLAHAYAAHYYSVNGTRMNKMIRNDEFKLIQDGMQTDYKLEESTINDIKATIILSHGLFQHHSTKTHETYRLLMWPQSFFPLGYWPSISYYSQEPAFLSFSEKSGAGYFDYQTDQVYYFVHISQNFGVDISPLSKYPNEREIMLPPGTEIHYQVVNQFMNIILVDGTLVSSCQDQKEDNLLTKIPQIKRPSDLIQNYFLQYIYDNFYNKSFKDVNEWGQDAELSDGKVVVYKPNHGRVHALRKMERVIFCILFFAEHSNNKDLAEFCQQLLNQDEIEVLDEKVKTQQLIDEIALLTGSTSIGRESEYSFSDNQEKYQEYRRQSVERFLEFLESETVKKMGFVISKKRLDIYKDVLTHFGEPDYMSQMTGLHLSIMHLINTPQVLDMCRCFETELSMNILTQRLEPVIYLESKQYLKPLMHFGVSWLQLTGDRILQKNEMVPSQPYKLSFLKYSTSGIFQCKKLLRQSPGIFFSQCVPTQKTATDELTYKMVEHLSATMILKNNKMKIDRNEVTTELAILIHEMAKLQIPTDLRKQFLEILVKKKIRCEYLTTEDKAKALIATVEEEDIPSEIVQTLLEAKVCPNFQNKEGVTALMVAVSKKAPLWNQAKIQLLLDYKADPNLQSNENESALDNAKKSLTNNAYFLLSKFDPTSEQLNLTSDQSNSISPQSSRDFDSLRSAENFFSSFF